MKTLIRSILVLWLVCVVSNCFGAAIQIEALWNGLRDNSGQPLASGKVYTYSSGTLTPKSTWVDAGKSSTQTNPIILDAYGRAAVYADGVYKLIIKDANDVTLATLDGMTYADPTDVTSTSLSDVTITSANIASLTSPGAVFTNANISSSTFTNGYITGATINAPTLSNPNLTNATVGLGANMDANSYKITELATPTSATDGSNKGYVDAAITAISGSVSVSGDYSSDPSLGAITYVNIATSSTTCYSHSLTNAGGSTRTYFYTYQFWVTPKDAEGITLQLEDNSGNIYANTKVENKVASSSGAVYAAHPITLVGAWTITAGQSKTLYVKATATTAAVSNGFAYYANLIRKGMSW